MHTSLEHVQNNYSLDLGPKTQLLPNEDNLTCCDEATEEGGKEDHNAICLQVLLSQPDPNSHI